MSGLDVAALRAVAEATDLGKWTLHDDRTVRRLDRDIVWDDSCQENEMGLDEGRYIAAFDPPTVLALLDRLEVAEADRDATLDRLSEMTRQKWAAEDAVARVRALVPVVRFDEEPPRTEMLLRREVVIALDQPAPTTPGGDA